MSKVFNMVGGGAGKNISSIVITGLSSTDTVTCTKDGKSYPATWDETAQHWEIVGLPFGTFALEATNGAKTTTETVLIDIAGVYEIEMSYNLWLYKDGDERSYVTGGWSDYDKNANQRGYRTANAISLANYSKMCCEFKYIACTDGALNILAGSFNSGDIKVGIGVVTTVEWDISSYTESANIDILTRQNSNGDVTFKRQKYDDHLYLYKRQLGSNSYLVELEVYKLWLE